MLKCGISTVVVCLLPPSSVAVSGISTVVVCLLPPSSVAVSGISTVVVCLLPKQETRVRFSYPAYCYCGGRASKRCEFDSRIPLIATAEDGQARDASSILVSRLLLLRRTGKQEMRVRFSYPAPK